MTICIDDHDSTEIQLGNRQIRIDTNRVTDALECPMMCLVRPSGIQTDGMNGEEGDQLMNESLSTRETEDKRDISLG